MQLAPVSVVLIDDHQVLLEALGQRLALDSRIRVVGTFPTGNDAFPFIVERQPHVVLMDVDLPGRGAFDLAEELATRSPHTKLVFLTGHLRDIYIAHALRVRAAGYLLKGESIERLCEAICRAPQGEMTFSAAVAARVTFDPVRRVFLSTKQSQLDELTGRQLEVLRQLAMGRSVKEIAQLMHLSQKSIDSHKYRIMNKLNIHDRVELARYAIREGLTPI